MGSRFVVQIRRVFAGSRRTYRPACGCRSTSRRRSPPAASPRPPCCDLPSRCSARASRMRRVGAPLAMEHVRRLPDLDHVNDVEDHRHVDAVGGGARFDEGELRLGAVEHERLRAPGRGARLPASPRRPPRPDRVRGSPRTGRGRTAAVDSWPWPPAVGASGSAGNPPGCAPTARPVDGGHRRHAGVLLLARPQAVERGECSRCRRRLSAAFSRLAQVLVMQHHALAVEGEHPDVSDRLARRRSARRVEGVARERPTVPPDAWAFLGPAMARQLEQRFVERPRCGRFGHPARTLTLSRQVQRRIERMQTVVTGMRSPGARPPP